MLSRFFLGTGTGFGSALGVELAKAIVDALREKNGTSKKDA